MIEVLLGSINRERVLMFLYCRKEGYAREIARFFEVNLSQIQKQLERLEQGNVIYCKQTGKTNIYKFNPRFPFLSELNLLLEKMYSFYSKKEKEKLSMNRRRPRRKGKPL